MNCDKCNRPIPLARMQAVPDTRLCVQCKSETDEPPLKANNRFVQGALVEASAYDGRQERAIEAVVKT